MNNDFLKEAWQDAAGTPTEKSTLQHMLLESKHPVLKKTRRQIIWEVIAFTAFLLVYNDFFDGAQKQLYANAMLISGFALVILHHISGYFLLRKQITDLPVKAALEKRLRTLRRFAIISVGCRVLAAACLLVFFASVIKFTPVKYWMLAGIVLLFITQLSLLGLLWKKRIASVRSVVNSWQMD